MNIPPPFCTPPFIKPPFIPPLFGVQIQPQQFNDHLIPETKSFDQDDDFDTEVCLIGICYSYKPLYSLIS